MIIRLNVYLVIYILPLHFQPALFKFLPLAGSTVYRESMTFAPDIIDMVQEHKNSLKNFYNSRLVVTPKSQVSYPTRSTKYQQLLVQTSESPNTNKDLLQTKLTRSIKRQKSVLNDFKGTQDPLKTQLPMPKTEQQATPQETSQIKSWVPNPQECSQSQLCVPQYQQVLRPAFQARLEPRYQLRYQTVIRPVIMQSFQPVSNQQVNPTSSLTGPQSISQPWYNQNPTISYSGQASQQPYLNPAQPTGGLIYPTSPYAIQSPQFFGPNQGPAPFAPYYNGPSYPSVVPPTPPLRPDSVPAPNNHDTRFFLISLNLPQFYPARRRKYSSSSSSEED